VDIILVLNAIVVTFQSYPILVGETVAFDPHMSNGVIDTMWEVFETIFTILYVLEFLVKWTVFGWKR
jgi:ABC-type polar amino acid transport system ATPase subunit